MSPEPGLIRSDGTLSDPPGDPGGAGDAQLLMLSADTPAALNSATTELIDRLERHPDVDLGDVAEALRADRPERAHRRIAVAADAAGAAAVLRDSDPRWVFTAGPAAHPRPVVWLFSGVGDQYQGMAAGLARSVPRFRHELDRCCAILQPELGVDLRDLLHPGGAERAEADRGRPDLAALFDQGGETGDIHRTEIAQPLLFATQYALARTLQSVGVEPAALLGYSVGEYVAACVAGVVDLEPALRLIALRARLVAGLPAGLMLAVMSEPEALAPHLGDGVEVAALDGPGLTVLAGPPVPVAAVAERLTAAGIASRRLATTHAFHSTMMDAVVGPLRAALDATPLRPPSIPVLSNVTGTWLRADEATSPDYWAGHLRRAIRFDDELAHVWGLDEPIVMELGPGRALANLAARHARRPADDCSLVVPTLPGRFESHPDRKVLLATLGRLWASGAAIDADALVGG